MSRTVLLMLLLLPAAPPPAAAQPVSMDQCVRYALTNSPAIRRADLALQNRRLDTVIARAKFAIGLGGSASRDVTAEGTSGSLEVKKEFVGGINLSSKLSVTDAQADESDAAGVSVTLSKVILGGGSFRESLLGIDNSLIDELIALNSLSKSQREIEYRVRQTYYRIIRTTQYLKIRELKLEAAKKNLEHAVERDNPLDVATARMEVPDSEASVLSARKDIDSSLDALKEIMGMDVNAPLEIDTNFDFREEATNPTNDIAYCLENHESLLNARLARKQTENELDAIRSRVWPKVTLSGTASQGSEGSMDLDGETDYSIGLSFSWELGAQAERATVQKTENDIRMQDISIQALGQERQNTIRNLSRGLREAQQLVRLQEERVNLAVRRSQLYADRWDNGEIDILEYIRSQNELQDSKIQLINYKTNYMDLLAQYRFEVAR